MTKTQAQLKIADSAEIFFQDTVKSARDLARPDLIKVLTYQSASGVEWLQDRFGLALDQVARLGGHSEIRTHRSNTEKFPGMEITYALMEKMEDLAKEIPDRVKIIKKARVTELLKEGNDVAGVVYEYKGQKYKDYGPVVLATGGYAADFGENSLLKKWRPEIFDLSTTNGNHCTGDGHKMVMAIGGRAIDMEKVQVHPTGLVDPSEPGAKVKFLAAEALRGSGGILLDGNGDRFCDELGHRDYVTGMMNKAKGPIRLILNGASTKAIEWHCKHYTGRRLMKMMTSGDQVANEIGCSIEHLEQTFREYSAIAAGEKKDPWGKRFFHNAPYTVKDNLFHVAMMEPVLHYTQGGIEINTTCQVIDEQSKPIEGLFACGEIAGGVHGANRLGGSSLAGCVVFGRVAGTAATASLLKQLSSSSNANARLQQVSDHLQSEAPTPDDNAPSREASSKKLTQTYTMAEIEKHNKKDDLWMAVNGEVINATDFLEDHPGGEAALLLMAGRECSEQFNMLHERDTIEKYANECRIGLLQE